MVWKHWNQPNQSFGTLLCNCYVLISLVHSVLFKPNTLYPKSTMGKSNICIVVHSVIFFSQALIYFY